MTFNVWRGEDGSPAQWPQRKQVLMELLRHFEPDVLCIQEGHPTLQAAIKEALPHHDSITPPEPGSYAHRSWQTEGNIFWNTRSFELVHYGAEDVGIGGARTLNWVRLALKDAFGSGNFLVSTAHFPWVGGAEELSTGRNPRVEITRQVVRALSLQAGDAPTPVFFMGDLNESYHPTRILREAGFQDCFAALGLPNLPTHPARPSSAREESLPDRCIDWLFCKGHATPILANVLRGCFYGSSLNASDHFPVMAVYELGKSRVPPPVELLHELPYEGAW